MSGKITFHMLDGRTVHSDTYMKGPSHGKGCHWRSTGDYEVTEVLGEIETIDPNIEYIFGYEQKAFLKRQYKEV